MEIAGDLWCSVMEGVSWWAWPAGGLAVLTTSTLEYTQGLIISNIGFKTLSYKHNRDDIFYEFLVLD